MPVSYKDPIVLLRKTRSIFAEWHKTIRKEMGLSQEEFATLVGIDRVNISQYEREAMLPADMDFYIDMIRELKNNFSKYEAKIPKGKRAQGRPTRSVIATDIETGRVLKFPSSTLAAEVIGCKDYIIRRACSGIQKTAVGFTWEYVQEDGGEKK